MSRPSIGITSYWRDAVMGEWALDAAFIAQGYVEGVRLAGGRAVVLPPDPLWEHEPDDVLDLLDGLVVAGGEDVGSRSLRPRAAPAHGAQAPPPRRGQSWGSCAERLTATCPCSPSAAASSF